MRHEEDEKQYAIGSKKWPGLSKLTEELGEVQQVIGKLIQTGGQDQHWDGGPPLRERLEDEMADLAAALMFVAEANGLDVARMGKREREKLALFRQWHMEAQGLRWSEERG